LMTKTIKDELLNKPLQLYVSGFGVGLSLGVGVLSLQPMEVCNLIEY